MQNINFQNISMAFASQADADPLDMRACLAKRALQLAAQHDLDSVHAYARGCERNAFAEEAGPIFMFATQDDRDYVRTLISDVIEDGGQSASERWVKRKAPPEAMDEQVRVAKSFSDYFERVMEEGAKQSHYEEAPNAGTKRFLKCRSQIRARRCDHFAA